MEAFVHSCVRFIQYVLHIEAFSHPCERFILYILYIEAFSHPCVRFIQYVLYIEAFSHPCERFIQYVLYLKKRPLAVFLCVLFNAASHSIKSYILPAIDSHAVQVHLEALSRLTVK